MSMPRKRGQAARRCVFGTDIAPFGRGTGAAATRNFVGRYAHERPGARFYAGDGVCMDMLTAAVAAQPETARSSAGQQPDSGAVVRYEVQPSDVLQVSVWREPELSQQVLVRPGWRVLVSTRRRDQRRRQDRRGAAARARRAPRPLYSGSRRDRLRARDPRQQNLRHRPGQSSPASSSSIRASTSCRR